MPGPKLATLKLRGYWPWRPVIVTGGPFARCPRHAFGVNMAAAEVLGGDIRVPVVDFGVPDPEVLLTRALYACYVALQGKDEVYVGCGFGIGRTGTFLAVMARITNPECDRIAAGGLGGYRKGGVVGWLRARYRNDAVETAAQEKLVNSLDVKKARDHYRTWIWQKRFGLPMTFPTILPW